MIDAHCHLQDVANFEPGKNQYICNGYDLPSSIKAIEMANKFPGVFAAVGLGYEQPIVDLNKARDELVKLAASPLVVAVGECGLDDPPQLELFDWHIQLARELNLPLVVHCRNAFTQILNLLKRTGSLPVRGVQMHCWTGNWGWAKKFLDLGCCYLSFGGIVTFKDSHELREVVANVPSDKLLIETDSPYIRVGLTQVTKVVAKARNMTVTKLDEITTANAYALFPKLKVASLA